MILSGEDFRKTWGVLSEFLRYKRLEKSYRLMVPLFRKQLCFLNDYEKNNNKGKDCSFLYAFNNIRNFWDNVELAFNMGRKKDFRGYTFYPVRVCMENFLRFKYFCNKSSSEKDIITYKELLRILARTYNGNKLNGIIESKNIQDYKNIASNLKIPDIDDVKDKDLISFPNMFDLCGNGKDKLSKRLYGLYQFLCEKSHGKLIATVMRYQAEEFEEHRRVSMLLVDFCKKMLILVDKNYLESKLEDEVKTCIKKIEEVVMGPKSNFEKICLFLSR